MDFSIESLKACKSSIITIILTSSRLKKWALNENYLIPGIKSKKVMQVQENKIRTKLGQS